MKRHDFDRAVQITQPRKNRLTLAVAMACLSLSPFSFQSATAATFTWDGGGGNGDWSNGANWVGNTSPGDFQDLVFTGNVQTNSNNDLILLFTNSITFDAGADPFTLTSNVLFDFGGITNASAATQTINLFNPQFRGDQTITNTNGGSLIFGNAANLFRFDFLPTTITFAGNGTTTINSQMVGSSAGGGIVKDGSGTLILNNSTNNFSGAVTVNAGLMQAGAAGAFVGNRSYTVNGGTLDLNDFNLTMSSLAGTGGTVDLGTAALTVNQTSITTYAGAIAGTGDLIKQGTGTLMLTGTNTHTGGTTISAGTLQIGNGGTVGSITGNVTDNSILAFNRSDAITFGGAINGSGQLQQIGSGTLSLTNTNTYTGGTLIDAGTISIDAGDQLGSGTVTLNNAGILSLSGSGITLNNAIQVGAAGGTLIDNFFSAHTLAGNITLNGDLTLDGANVFTVQGDIGGTGALIASMANGVVITGDATHTGGTSLQQGILQIGAGGTTGSISGNITTVASTLLAFSRSDSLTYAGNVSGAGSVVKGGAGTLTLSGNHTYSGDTTISGGTLEFTGSTAGLGGNIIDDTALIFNQAANSSFAGVISSTGSVTKDGEGTLTLTGDNTYTGTTTISAGELVFDGGTNTIGSITAAGGDLTIQNGATVNNDTGFVGRTGIGAATATVTGAGSAWNTTGDLAVSEIIPFPLGGVGGTLRVQNGGQVNAGGELFLDIGGVLEIDSSSQVTAANSLRAVAGTVRLLDSGALNIPDIVISGVAGIIDTNGFNGTYAGSISTNGTPQVFVKQGAGTLTLTGNHTDNNLDAFVGNGVLLINSTFVGDAMVNTNGILGGAGSVGAVTFGSGGIIAPGNSIGTLNVASVDFSGGGVYAVEVNAAGASDLINATGTATLTSGSVQVIPAAGSYATSTDYTILTAAGGLGGTTFGSASSTFAFLTPTLSYDANNVYLNMALTSDYASVASTSNQAEVGAALDTLFTTGATAGLDDIFNNLNILTADGARQAFDSLSGVQHTHAQTIAIRSSQQFKGLLFDRLGGNGEFLANDGKLMMLAYNDNNVVSDAGSASSDRLIEHGWWLRGTGNFGDIDDTRNASGADYRAGGIAAGVDTNLGENITVGAAFGYTHTSADVAQGDLGVDSYQVALYGSRVRGDYYLSGTTGFGYHDVDAKRQVTVGGFSDSAHADYKGWTGNIAVEGGRKFTLGNDTAITPFLGVEYTHLKRDSFTEKGAGAANLHMDDENQNSLLSSLGVRFSHSWTTAKGFRIQPMAEFAWAHEFMDDEASIKTGFAAAPNVVFHIDGPELDRDRARLGLGLNMQLAETASLNIAYQGEFASSDASHNLAATFRMEW